MDPRNNPYSPGAGTPPPELAGRDEIIDETVIALDRIRRGRAGRSLLLYGLRGVGKTVLLNRIRADAERRGFLAVSMEAPEGRSLPALLAPHLRGVLLKLSRAEAARDLAGRGLRALAGFVSAFRVSYADIEVSVEAEPEAGLADSGDLELDLYDLLGAVGEAARARGTAVVIAIDELQYVERDQLASLIAAIHRVAQEQLPVVFMAAGLPQLLGMAGEAKSYAERLFEFTPIGRLEESAARRALCKPAEDEQVSWDEAAVAEVLRQTQGYPYFLQEWGAHCWRAATGTRIELSDARRATAAALEALDAGFFKVRLDRATQSEKRYLRAMAELGPGPHRSSDIAEMLGRKITSVAPTRSALIHKGIVFGSSHGDTAFTVPLFDAFLRRAIPEWKGPAPSSETLPLEVAADCRKEAEEDLIETAAPAP